jgi:translation initiation factor IF-3
VGIVETSRAQQMAREAGLDLVEVAPGSRPPVCRIMDYGKWKYQQKKKEAKAKAHSKQSELKEVRLRPSTDEHDKQLKMDRARRFLDEGHKVQFTMMFRGRQMAHKDIGFRQFEEISQALSHIAKVEVPPRSMGRRMTMIIAPLAKTEQTRKSQSKSQSKAGAGKPADGKPPNRPADTPAQASAAPPAAADSSRDAPSG